MLVSGVSKLMRVTWLPPGLVLYRGLGGLMSLPEAFYRAAADGCVGFAEWGFFSTTSNRAVAIQVHSRPASPLPTASLGALRYIPQPTCPPACMYSYLQALRGLGGLGSEVRIHTLPGCLPLHWYRCQWHTCQYAFVSTPS